jgi:hypothetical protein
LYKINKVFKGRVQMSFFAQRDDFREMGVVDVRIDPEQALEDGADDGDK